MKASRRHGSKIIWENNGEILWLEPYGANCLRFRSTIANRITENDWTLLPQIECDVRIAFSERKATIENGKIQADEHFHWTEQGEWKFDRKNWPDPKAMTDELNRMDIKLMVSIWPTVDQKSENHDVMKRNNYLVRTEKGVQSLMLHPMDAVTFYDATHPDAQIFVWSKCKENYYDFGIKNFWLDEAEPELEPYDFENVRYHLGNGLEVRNSASFFGLGICAQRLIP